MTLRLSHRILDQEHTLHWSRDFCTREDSDSFLEDFKLDDCAKIIADNVAEYNFQRFEVALRKTDQKDIGNLAPPFTNFFIEYQHPLLIHKQYGALCHGITKGEHPDLDKDLLTTPWKSFDWKWIVTLKSIITFKNGICVLVGDYIILLIRGDGCLQSWNVTPGELCRDFDLLEDGKIPPEKQQEALWSVFGDILMTINFMNCRNVELADVTAERGPSKKWLKRRKQPKLVYRTVVIDPNKPQKRGASDNASTGNSNLTTHHIRRGHFINYKDDGVSKGMFGQGRYGTFWVPSHEVGDKENGQSITSYKVKAPKP